MVSTNKEFFKRIISFLLFYFSFGILFGITLVKTKWFFTLFCLLSLPYIIFSLFSRFDPVAYILNGTYLFLLNFACLLSAIVFTLLPPENAMYYYGLPSPENYIACAFCTLPFIALFIHMAQNGCKSKEDIEKAYTQDSKKINLSTGEYYLNQGINVFNGVTRVRMKDMWLNKFMEKHINITYWVVLVTSGLGPAIPLLISRNAGQQPLNYFFLICVSYLALLCAYLIPINFHLIRTVLYIQKKHNIKLKLAYKDDKDIVIV